MKKLKVSITDAFRIDDDTKMRGKISFQHALYGKLFAKSSTFEYVKTFLLSLWNSIGIIHISDMPSGYLLNRCETDDVK